MLPPLPSRVKPTTATYVRSGVAGGLAFLGPPVLYPILEWTAQVSHVEPQPSAVALVAMSSFASGLFTALASFFIRQLNRREGAKERATDK